MAITEDRMAGATALERLWESSPSEDEAPHRPAPPPSAPSRPLGAWPRIVMGAWVAVMAAILIFEPVPDDAAAPTPLWVDLAFLGFTAGLVATFSGLAARRRWGFGASAAAAAFGVGLAVACSATGHHLGGWWITELVAFAGLGALSGLALRKA